MQARTQLPNGYGVQAWCDVIPDGATEGYQNFRPGAHHVRLTFPNNVELTGHGRIDTGSIGAWTALLGGLFGWPGVTWGGILRRARLQSRNPPNQSHRGTRVRSWTTVVGATRRRLLPGGIARASTATTDLVR